MILWSKGLGKLVLYMSLADRSSTNETDDKLEVAGTMGPPTHWDYSVNMGEHDVLDMVELLKQPAPVQFVVEAQSTSTLVKTALLSGVLFAWNTIRCFLGLAGNTKPQSITAVAAAPPEEASKASAQADPKQGSE
ncbi:MAG: hypothetical protein QF570_16210 [Myxococcota bacterium]|jgi:hypothetical protein|nr:hypothetical protein [Myxococcota bacterium]